MLISFLFPALVHAAAVTFTFSEGPFAGAEVRAGNPVLVQPQGGAKGNSPKKPAATWGTVEAIEQAEGRPPRFTVKGADGQTKTLLLREVSPEKPGDLEAGGQKFSRGDHVLVPEQEDVFRIETFFYPDFALLKNFATRELRLEKVSSLAKAPAPVMPPLRVELFTQLVSSAFELTPRGASEASRLRFRPAESYYLGVSAGYKGLGLSYAFSVPASEEIRKFEGESQYRDLRLNYYSRRFAVELAYSRYNGYLLETVDGLNPATLNGGKYLKLPNLEAEGHGANFLYVFSPQAYSLPAGNDHSEIQTESAGSWLGMATFRRQSVRNSGTIIPTEQQAIFGEEGTITGYRTFSYGAGPGYGYHWLPRSTFLGDSFFVAPLLALSFGYETVSEDLATRARDSGTFGLNVHARLGFGWNVPGFFVVFSVLTDAFTGRTDATEITGTHSAGGLSVGARF